MKQWLPHVRSFWSRQSLLIVVSFPIAVRLFRSLDHDFVAHGAGSLDYNVFELYV